MARGSVLNMNTKEALRKLALYSPTVTVREEIIQIDILVVAPKIEEALRAAYGAGHDDACLGQKDKYCGVLIPERGVIVGNAELREKT